MKTKKVTFGKSLENLTKYQFEFLQNIKGGVPNVPIVIHIPTRANPSCVEGYEWNEVLKRCVRTGVAESLDQIRTN
ncbi:MULTISPECIES: hypothetical protein [Flavobacterium]|uniref:Uncharacterized protein n=1 Tax=Flavobacterium jumunjinense TaxID=998845 RepID=A0ABV5GTM6_9FLAO|nr:MULTISPECIES: hypothetical protein [Flavobacterium]